jgi:precorrin-2 dehydrogenase/sirohydrochlorin ferrochelatase
MPVEAPLYPANLVVAGRRCLVVGGGHVALGKARELVACGAVVDVVAPAIVDELAGLDVTCHRRGYEPGEAAAYRLVITATDDPAVNRQVFLDGEAHGVWVNAADDTDNCSFTLPSRIRQGPLLVTFATGGVSPALTRWLRTRFEGEFGTEYLTLLELLADERRRLHDAGRPTEGLNWQGALDSGMLEMIREGRLAEAKETLTACLSSSSD